MKIKTVIAILVSSMILTSSFYGCSSPGSTSGAYPISMLEDGNEFGTEIQQSSSAAESQSSEEASSQTSSDSDTTEKEKSDTTDDPIKGDSSSDTSENPDKHSDTVTASIKNTPVSLTEKQMKELTELAQRAVEQTDTMLNTIITQEDMEEATQNGVYITASIPDLNSDGKAETIYLLINAKHSGSACINGGSKHLVSGEIVSSVYELLNYEPSDQKTSSQEDPSFTTDVINITSDQLAAVPANTTYRSITEQLGYGANFGRAGLLLYKLDKEKLLIFHFNDLNDKCPQSGSELAQTAVSLKIPEQIQKQMDANSHLCYGIVIDDSFIYTESVNYEKCYQLQFPKTTDSIQFADGSKATVKDITSGNCILAEFTEVMESYPPIALCQKTTLFPNQQN